MTLIESVDAAGFKQYLQEYGNTICGRHPISVLLHVRISDHVTMCPAHLSFSGLFILLCYRLCSAWKLVIVGWQLTFVSWSMHNPISVKTTLIVLLAMPALLLCCSDNWLTAATAAAHRCMSHDSTRLFIAIIYYSCFYISTFQIFKKFWLKKNWLKNVFHYQIYLLNHQFVHSLLTTPSTWNEWHTSTIINIFDKTQN